MINFTGRESIKPAEQRGPAAPLPAGAYVGKIFGAKLDTDSAGHQVLILQLDVTEGEYAQHYHKMYEAMQGGSYPAKYKGTLRFSIPYDDDPWRSGKERALSGMAWCLESSNPGYHWDWDETKLKGLNVGFSVREREYVVEKADKSLLSGVTTEIGRLEVVEKVKAGAVQPMRRKELSERDKKRLSSSAAGFVEVTAEEEDNLPF